MVQKNGSSVLREIVTLTDLAALCVCSERTIQRLTKEGVLRQAKDRKTRRLLRGRYELGDVVPRLFEHLRDQVSDDDPNEALYKAARARKMEALATSEEMRVKLQKGELMPRERVIFVVGNVLTATKNHLLSLASRITRQLLPHVAAETQNDNFRAIYEIVNGEVRQALTEASEFDMKQLVAVVSRDDDD